MNINIYSNNEFLIEYENQSHILDDSNHIIVTDCTNEVTFKAYPIDQSMLSIPFAFSLKIKNNTASCLSQNVKVYNLKNRADVFLSPFLIASTNCIYSQSHTIKNVKYLVTAYEDRIKISSSKGEYTFNISLSQAQSESVSNYIYILTKLDKKTLVCFDTTLNTFKSITADQIDLKESEIVARQNIDDMAHHTKVLTLKNDLSISKTENYVDSHLSKMCKRDELIPYNFFEAIKFGDKNEALSLVSENMKEALKNQDIEQFFGEFEKINITSLSPLVYTLYYPDDAKDFKITMIDHKIAEIED